MREWTAADVAAVDALLDADPDPLWAGQGHRLHGPPREGKRWRRTLVAEEHGEVVGAVTLGRNYVHPARYSCAFEVGPAHRRRGLGRQLVAAARELRPEPLPLSAKVREHDRAGMALMTALGGRVYQRSPCPVVRTGDDATTEWCTAHAGAGRPMTDVEPAELAIAFADMYRWLHEGWSPVGSATALAEVSASMISELDHEVSAGVRRDGRLSAVAFAFPGADGIECVAETMSREEPDGAAALAAAIAACLMSAADAGIDSVEFDGHVVDPHLAPLVETLPIYSSHPLLLVELP
jgi:GNAT superfamily N-acetyltransferase